MYHEALRVCSSIPRCSIALNLSVSGNGTLAATQQKHPHHYSQSDCEFWFALSLVIKPAKVQLIQPPIRIMGRTLVSVPFNISNAILGSGISVGVRGENAARCSLIGNSNISYKAHLPLIVGLHWDVSHA